MAGESVATSLFSFSLHSQQTPALRSASNYSTYTNTFQNSVNNTYTSTPKVASDLVDKDLVMELFIDLLVLY